MNTNKNISFSQFLKNFGYNTFRSTTKGVFEYNINFASEKHINTSVLVPFFCLPNDADIFKIQEEIWNRNNVNIFIVVGDNSTFIYNGKVKPQKDKPSHAKIADFNYGLKNQSSDFPDILRKEKLDGGYFFDFVIEKRKKNREQEVDKDLLLNLIALRQDLLKISDDNDTIHLLILRCLFLKYLEDRGIYEPDYLIKILETGKSKNLLVAFEEISKINGDIFKYDSLSEESIHEGYLPLLALFFQTDYRFKQGRLFPYKFNFIPIQLISNVYEAFLSNAKKQGKGIYYTPKFVVDFMLSQTLIPELKTNKHLSIFDPACGSGAYLVEGFKAIVKSAKAEKDFELKKDILKNRIFGVDNDAKALQIATFSLYLALLENLDPEFIKYQIEHQTPILPSLIGENLICGNSLTDDDLFKDKTFDCILANPPWGSVPKKKDKPESQKDKDDNLENQKERTAIGGKGQAGTIPEYKNVSDYQRSQAFLLRVKKWTHEGTKLALIVNNSVLLNENAKDFRKDFISNYKLDKVYELSYINKIVFKKNTIGKVNNKKVEVGATEPSAILFFSGMLPNDSNIVEYISPKLTKLSENLRFIHVLEADRKRAKQDDFIKDDLLWRIFVNGGWDDYQLIKSQILSNDKREVYCSRGFEPKKNATLLGKPYFRKLITSKDFKPYTIVTSPLQQFNWNQKLRRRVSEALYIDKRILIAYRPIPSDNLKLRCIYIEDDIVFKNDILYCKIEGIENYLPYLAVLNSSFIGYYLFQTSAQWQGGIKREVLRTYDIKNIPFPNFERNNQQVNHISKLVNEISQNPKLSTLQRNQIEQQIDNLVFDLYGLTEFEKAVIREFYDVNVHRKGDKVNKQDLKAYFNKFKEVFELALEDSYTIEAHYKISKNLGAFMVFQIKEKPLAGKDLKESTLTDDDVFHAIKKSQLEDAFYSNRLNEQKTKVYESERFFMIKSHFFKDWTVRQAIKDANEEIKTLVQETAIG